MVWLGAARFVRADGNPVSLSNGPFHFRKIFRMVRIHNRIINRSTHSFLKFDYFGVQRDPKYYARECRPLGGSLDRSTAKDRINTYCIDRIGMAWVTE